jgi:drug/metabolite transporter (DMT)-like permease
MRQLWEKIKYIPYVSEVPKFFKKGDLVLLFLCLLTSAFGCLVVASATNHNGTLRYVVIQAVAVVLGVVMYILVSGINTDFIAEHRMALVVFNGNFILKLSPLGDILALAACLCWALYTLIIKRLQDKYSNMLITRKVFGYGLLTILPLLCVNGVNVRLLADGGAMVWGNILFLGCVASMLCFLGWNWCLGKIGSVSATNLLYLNPVVAITTSALVLGERVTWVAIIGALLILSGLYMLGRK